MKKRFRQRLSAQALMWSAVLHLNRQSRLRRIQLIGMAQPVLIALQWHRLRTPMPERWLSSQGKLIWQIQLTIQVWLCLQTMKPTMSHPSSVRVSMWRIWIRQRRVRCMILNCAKRFLMRWTEMPMPIWSGEVPHTAPTQIPHRLAMIRSQPIHMMRQKQQRFLTMPVIRMWTTMVTVKCRMVLN